jgi:hypothetical protein
MNAHQNLESIVAETARIQADVDNINAADARLRQRRAELKAGIDAAQHAVETQQAALASALSEGNKRTADHAREALRSASRAALPQVADGFEISAIDAAIEANAAKAQPLAERLMVLARQRSDIGIARLREYGVEVAREHRALAQQFAKLLAKAHALNRIAYAAGAPTIYAPVGRPLSLVLDGLGDGQRVVVDYEGDVAGHRASFVQRLAAEGHNIIGM